MTEPVSASETSATVRKVTVVGMFVNIVLAVLKIAAGFLFACQSLLADGVHSFSDLITDFAVIAGVQYWSRPPDKEHPYGHARIETLVTAFIGVMLALVGIGIGWDAVRILCKGNPGGNTHRLLTFFAAVLSIISKELLYRWTVVNARKVQSPAMEANAWHHRSDAFSSLPVAVAILLTLLFPSMWFVDQIGAIIVSGFILYAAWEITHPALVELSESGAPPEIYEIAAHTAMIIPGVLAVHCIRARRFGNSILIDMHILVNGESTVCEGHRIAHEVHDKLVAMQNLRIADVVVHVEPYSQEAMNESVFHE